MIHQAAEEHDIDLHRSWLIGDKASDIQAGLAAGVKPILVMTGYGEDERALLGGGILCADTIAEASARIITDSAQAVYEREAEC